MHKEVYALTLKNTLNEIENACPTISHAFIFKENEKIVAKDDDTDEETIKRTIAAFVAITDRANTVGGLESITFRGTYGRVSITCIKDFYLTTIATKESDEKYINTLTRVWVPTVLRLVEKIRPASTDDDDSTTLKPEPTQDDDLNDTAADTEAYEEESSTEEADVAEPQPEPIQKEADSEVSSESLLLEAPVNQVIVETLGGLLVPADTVRIDSAIVERWNELYAGKKIEHVYVETLNRMATRCKFKAINDPKHEGKGTVQMPEKMQLALRITEGELVMVKPLIG